MYVIRCLKSDLEMNEAHEVHMFDDWALERFEALKREAYKVGLRTDAWKEREDELCEYIKEILIIKKIEV